VLDKLVQRVDKIYAVDVDISNSYLKVNSQYEGDTELIAKVQIMDKYPAKEKIAIGDSITDLNMALQASVVFARPPLTKYLDEQHKSYVPWNDFLEIRDYLAQSWS
jgi:2-hydroxy-3-keto-5-methylthiopentenyl-1-phosphate phosphatase